MNPKVFVGSSVEGLKIAYAIQEELKHDADLVIWTQRNLKLNDTYFFDLYNSIGVFDFAIFVCSPDDPISIRGEDKVAIRDNVLLELGLFIGSIGRDRCFFMYPLNEENLRLPTDLVGITAPTYDATKIQNLVHDRSALGPACNQIRGVIRSLGELPKRHLAEFFDRNQDAPSFQEILKSAKREMFSFGPSLTYVAQNIRELVFNRAKEGIKIRLMIMANDPKAVEYVNDYASASNFIDERDVSQDIFSSWQKKANSQNLKIFIRVAPGILPISVNIIDPELPTGKMLIIPFPYKTSGTDRSSIYVNKEGNPHSINNYFTKFNLLWDDSEDILNA